MNFSLKETIKKPLENGTEEPICRARTETQTERRDTEGEGAGETN